jgi:hypothetical protein
MCKVSVLFKRSRKSWINNILQEAWFYELKYSELIEDDNFIKSKKKVRILWVPYNELWELYHDSSKYFNENAIVVLMCCITDLFE